MWDGINRRNFPRAHYKAIIYLQKQGDQKTISTYTENVGGGGICVVLKENLSLFDGVGLELDLKNGLPSNVKCAGTVVWVVKKHLPPEKDTGLYDIGIEFVDMDEKSRERIVKIVAAHLKK